MVTSSGLVAVGAARADGEAWVGLLVAGLVLLLVVLLDRWFMSLRVTVTQAGVTARFGPFAKRLPAEALASAEAEGYRWMTYGGWGIRWGTQGRRAWSVPFLGTGVAVALTDGSRYFISSRSPERLRSSIVEVIEARGGTRG